MEKYRVVKEIGTGAYSKVYLGEHLETREKIIIKKIDFTNLNEKEKELINSEISIIRKFSSPYIVRFMESFNSGLLTCLIMEYCNKGDLYNEMVRKRRSKEKFSEESLFQWIFDVLKALELIHKNSVIHRDLKPENIFLHELSSGLVVAKVGDFGLSRALTQGRVFANTFAGTPLYMAPELVQSQRYTNKVDIWSLGCITFELCTFQPAFNGTQLNRIMSNIVNKEIGKIGSEYSRNLQHLIDKMLVRSPTSRPSASALIASPFFRKQRAALASAASPASSVTDTDSKPPNPAARSDSGSKPASTVSASASGSKPATPVSRADSLSVPAAPVLSSSNHSAQSKTAAASMRVSSPAQSGGADVAAAPKPSAPVTAPYPMPKTIAAVVPAAKASAAPAPSFKTASALVPGPKAVAAAAPVAATRTVSAPAPRPALAESVSPPKTPEPSKEKPLFSPNNQNLTFTFGSHCNRSAEVHHPVTLTSQKSFSKIRISSKPTFIPTSHGDVAYSQMPGPSRVRRKSAMGIDGDRATRGPAMVPARPKTPDTASYLRRMTSEISAEGAPAATKRSNVPPTKKISGYLNDLFSGMSQQRWRHNPSPDAVLNSSKRLLATTGVVAASDRPLAFKSSNTVSLSELKQTEDSCRPARPEESTPPPKSSCEANLQKIHLMNSTPDSKSFLRKNQSNIEQRSASPASFKFTKMRLPKGRSKSNMKPTALGPSPSQPAVSLSFLKQLGDPSKATATTPRIVGKDRIPRDYLFLFSPKKIEIKKSKSINMTGAEVESSPFARARTRARSDCDSKPPKQAKTGTEAPSASHLIPSLTPTSSVFTSNMVQSILNASYKSSKSSPSFMRFGAPSQAQVQSSSESRPGAAPRRISQRLTFASKYGNSFERIVNSDSASHQSQPSPSQQKRQQPRS